MTEPVLYSERGSSWWPVLWGPAFALLGLAVEALTPGSVNTAMWLLTGGVLAAATSVWVHGRRRLVSVRLTPAELVQGREELDISRIAAVTDVGAPVGARVLGGSWTVPKGTGEVPLRLEPDEVVLAWAKNPEALSAALARLVEK
ncbi:hypothetical protein [Saccharopolyspora phatthalungensis]|uniref:DUF3093 domain-containing protein n=1 Tax=Saccharopolyspora phatthalungensis TaxID=664693 RepID=A0A840QCL6_9PSEU|nr:hypothetical protein [Saccharopolyspora phatthalungensis]MBB5154643.1 hypothetical protein [Saccharopolyspora phatthalungensis]